jgi:glycosyltransferase involved in cell wall biosynthesis
VKLCFLVYDLLPLLHPHWFNPKRYFTFKRWLRTIALFGDDLICISGSVKADLSSWLTAQYGLGQPPPHLHSIPLGADLASTMPSAGCADQELELMEPLYRKPFILMVGTLEPRKGYAQTLDAFECYWAKGGVAALVVVGKPGWKTDALQARLRTHPEQNNRLFWFDNASDELLQLLYQAAAGVLLASEAEGCGLPLIEAAQYGKPALARNIPVFREIAGPNASFFDAVSFAGHLESWIQQIQNAKFCPGLAVQMPWSDSAVKLTEIVTKQR